MFTISCSDKWQNLSNVITFMLSLKCLQFHVLISGNLSNVITLIVSFKCLSVHVLISSNLSNVITFLVICCLKHNVSCADNGISFRFR